MIMMIYSSVVLNMQYFAPCTIKSPIACYNNFNYLLTFYGLKSKAREEFLEDISDPLCPLNRGKNIQIYFFLCTYH